MHAFCPVCLVCLHPVRMCLPWLSDAICLVMLQIFTAPESPWSALGQSIACDPGPSTRGPDPALSPRSILQIFTDFKIAISTENRTDVLTNIRKRYLGNLCSKLKVSVNVKVFLQILRFLRFSLVCVMWLDIGHWVYSAVTGLAAYFAAKTNCC